MEISTKPAHTGLSPEEEAKAAQYLAQARGGLAEAIKGLSAPQGSFKPAPDQWSIAIIVEHLGIVGKRVLERLEALSEGAAASPGRDNEAFAARLVSIMTDRSFKAQAPPPIYPTSTLDLSAAYQQFLETDRLMDSAIRTTPGLREHTLSHPFFGELDGYDWILVYATHTLRHLEQIREVKESRDFSG
ncbi:MAG TPA: DinB family protein [Bryobacteraceae bacterium]|nr:DinB family protein [Bryobacteraceae bacterium]